MNEACEATSEGKMRMHDERNRDELHRVPGLAEPWGGKINIGAAGRGAGGGERGGGGAARGGVQADRSQDAARTGDTRTQDAGSYERRTRLQHGKAAGARGNAEEQTVCRNRGMSEAVAGREQARMKAAAAGKRSVGDSDGSAYGDSGGRYVKGEGGRRGAKKSQYALPRVYTPGLGMRRRRASNEARGWERLVGMQEHGRTDANLKEHAVNAGRACGVCQEVWSVDGRVTDTALQLA
ncbi:hypothetical protein DFH06DRAFT_1365301 [Mycena polygramma]|nr:hypothetical protein DFH06DRAFT_1365301 [Mycena polygramma]